MVLRFWGVGPFGKGCARIFCGTIIKKTSQEKTRIRNHGEGLSCGIPLRVFGGHQFLA